jgi:hypothetical protein
MLAHTVLRAHPLSPEHDTGYHTTAPIANMRKKAEVRTFVLMRPLLRVLI